MTKAHLLNTVLWVCHFSLGILTFVFGVMFIVGIWTDEPKTAIWGVMAIMCNLSLKETSDDRSSRG